MASPPKRTGRDKHRFTGSFLENKYIRMNVNIARFRRNVKKINVKEKNAILGFVKRVGISTIKIHKKEHEKYRVIIIGVHIAVAGHSTKPSLLAEQEDKTALVLIVFFSME